MISPLTGSSRQQQAASRPNLRTYDRDFLYALRDYNQHKRHVQRISLEVCFRIRDLRLHKRRKRGKKGGWKHGFDGIPRVLRGHLVHQNNAGDSRNLIILDTEKGPQITTNLDKNVRILTLNCQSVKNKDTFIHQFLLLANIDICVLTETWVHDTDTAWMQGTDLVKDNFQAQFCNSWRWSSPDLQEYLSM